MAYVPKYTATAAAKPRPRARLPKAPKVLGSRPGQKGWNPSGSYAKPLSPGAPATPWTPPALAEYAPYAAAQFSGQRDRSTVQARYGTGAGDFGSMYGSEGGKVRSHYGLTAGADGALQVDASNPFGQAALLQRSYQQGQRGTSTSMAARGHLYSGALQSALGEGDRRYNASFDQMGKAYTAALDEITMSRQDALAQISDREGQAKADAISWQQSQRPAAPSQPTPPTYHPVVQKTMNKAQQLWNSGQKKGKAWADVQSILGYDPRPGKPKPKGAWSL